MKMKNSILGILSAAAVFAGAESAQAKLKVVTTLASFADIAQRVGGEDVEATSIVQGYQDPHFVDPKPSIVLQLNRASLLVRGGLGLEDGWLPVLVTGSRNGKIQNGGEGDLDASTLMRLKGVPKGTIDRTQGDVHPGGNPHYMLDPRNGLALAQGLADRLAKLDPEHAEGYRKRAEAYVRELEGKIGGWQKRFASLKGTPVVTYHASWLYFTDWVGLEEVGTVEPKPGIPPSPSHIAQLIPKMKAKKVKWVLMEPYYPKASAEEVSKQTGAPILVLPTEVGSLPEVKSYFDVFEGIAKKLVP